MAGESGWVQASMIGSDMRVGGKKGNKTGLWFRVFCGREREREGAGWKIGGR